jgi:hypothetical protein
LKEKNPNLPKESDFHLKVLDIWTIRRMDEFENKYNNERDSNKNSNEDSNENIQTNGPLPTIK